VGAGESQGHRAALPDFPSGCQGQRGSAASLLQRRPVQLGEVHARGQCEGFLNLYIVRRDLMLNRPESA